MTREPRFSVVTGASGFSGKYITRRLLASGKRVFNLTGHPDRSTEFGAEVKAIPFQFDDPDSMASNLRGASTLYNTYWVRFDRGGQTHERAVENTQALIRAAESAGVERIVHISITNPDVNSSLPYFRGKAILEQSIRDSGLPHTILRPAVIFGPEDILINNIAYLLRRFPLFVVPGDGDYRLQPIYADDLAELAVSAGAAEGNQVIDAVGPESFSFIELIQTIANCIGSRTKIAHVPPTLAFGLIKMLGLFVGDVVLTRDELKGLMADLLISREPPTGSTRLSDWLRENSQTIGARYASELKRHYSDRVISTTSH